MARRSFDDWGPRQSLRERLGSALVGNVNVREALEKAGLAEKRVETPGPKWYKYSAISAQGVRQKGKMQGPSAMVVSEALQSDGWIPLSVSEILQTGLSTDLGAIVGGRDVRLSTSEIATFARQLSELLRAGVPLVRALASLGEEQSPALARVCTELGTQVASGVPLSQSLGVFPKVFNSVFISYVAAGEQTGNLGVTMSRLAKNVEKQAAMQQKIKSVTAYPKFVSIVIGAVVVGIIAFLVPMYAKIYESFGSALPAPTLALMSISKNMLPFTFTRSVPWFVDDPAGLSFTGLMARVVGFVGLWLAFEAMRIRRGKSSNPFKMVARTILVGYVTFFGYAYDWNPGTLALYVGVIMTFFGFSVYRRRNEDNMRVVRALDRMRHRFPLFGGIWKRSEQYRWATTIGGALQSGVPMAAALELAAGTAGTAMHKLIARELIGNVRAGKPLSEGIAVAGDLFPSTLRAMVATGEQTGDLATMMDSVATAIDNETEALIAGLAAKIEVALLVLMAIVVGGLLMVLYLPILNLASAGIQQVQ